MTKLVTTVVALALYEKGAFQLDDPVDKFVDEFKDPGYSFQEKIDQ